MRPLVLLLLLSVLGESQVCVHDPERVRQAHVQALKQDLLNKLQVEENEYLSRSEVPVVIGPEVTRALDEYNAVVAALGITSRDQRHCTQYNRYSRQLLVFFPTDVTNVQLEDQNLLDAEKAKRSAEFTAHPVRHRLNFHLDLKEKHLLSSAELRLYKKPLEDSESLIPDFQDRVEIYRISYPEFYYGEELRQFITSKDIDRSSEGYEVFSVTSAIEEWLEQDSSNLEREIEFEVNIRCPEPLTGGHVESSPAIEFRLEIAGNGTSTQLVVASYERQGENRKKRATTPGVNSTLCLQNPQEPKCCLRHLELSFRDDLQMPYILRPPSYTANYCEGLCPTYWHQASNHTRLMNYLTDRNPTAAPAPCCVSDLFQSLPVMMVVTNETGRFIENKILNDVITGGCICR